MKPLVSLDKKMQAVGLMFDYFEKLLGITEDEKCRILYTAFVVLEFEKSAHKMFDAPPSSGSLTLDSLGLA